MQEYFSLPLGNVVEVCVFVKLTIATTPTLGHVIWLVQVTFAPLHRVYVQHRLTIPLAHPIRSVPILVFLDVVQLPQSCKLTTEPRVMVSGYLISMNRIDSVINMLLGI